MVSSEAPAQHISTSAAANAGVVHSLPSAVRCASGTVDGSGTRRNTTRFANGTTAQTSGRTCQAACPICASSSVVPKTTATWPQQ